MINNLSFFLIGLSHHQTSVEMREMLTKFFSAPENSVFINAELSALSEEYLLLSTCNRLEMIAVTQNPIEAATAIKQLIFKSIGPENSKQIENNFYIYENIDAAHHLFRVASSLDSLVLGEPQILGQVKEAYREALKKRSVGAVISKLMHKCFRAAKRVRSETSLAAGKVSVASAAVSLACDFNKGNLKGIKTVLLGAGPMAACAAGHLFKKGADVCVMSRTYEKAVSLAAKNKLSAREWDELKEAVAEAQLVITATGASEPILRFDNLNSTLSSRHDELLVIDISVPRNVSHDVKKIACVRLRNIDDLNTVVWESRLSRQDASVKAEEIIKEELKSLSTWLKAFYNRPTLKALTKKAESIRRMELKRTLNQCHFSPEQQQSLEAMTSALVRRLLHDPLIFIKNYDRSKACGNNDVCPAAPQNCVTCHQGSNPIASLRKAFNIESETKKSMRKQSKRAENAK